MKLYGCQEIATALGIKSERVRKWYERGHLPKPDARLSMGPVWTGRTIGAWIRERRKELTQEVTAA